MSRQYFSQLLFGIHELVPWEDQENVHLMACSISKASAGEISVPSIAAWVIFTSCFPNTCMMTREADDPRYLQEGYRCAVVIGRCCTNCHLLQLKTGYIRIVRVNQKFKPIEVKMKCFFIYIMHQGCILKITAVCKCVIN